MDDDVLSATGPLAARIAGFSERAGQRRMADAVASALASRSVLVVEAGTGTGKTFAYLVPALQSGRRVLVSTGTRNLQDQLFHKDLPAVREALGAPVEVALLKGRANYLCLERIERTEAPARFAREIGTIKHHAAVSEDGDIAGIDGVPEDSPVWPWVTSTTDNCLGTKCPHYDDCFVLRARQRAQEAEVIVVNHHLLFADLSLKESGFGELLPGTDAVIIDEAHQLAETANRFFGTTLSHRQLADLVRDATTAAVNDAPDTPGIREAADGLGDAVRGLRLAVGDDTQRKPWADWPGIERVEASLDTVRGALDGLAGALGQVAGRAASLESCWKRALETMSMLDEIVGTAPSHRDGVGAAPSHRDEVGEVPSHRDDVGAVPSHRDAVGAVPSHRDGVGAAPSHRDGVRWLESFNKGFSLHLTPLDLSGPLSQLFSEPPRAWVFTSATLAVGDRFDHFTRPLGLDALEPECLQLGSPFPYEENAYLYVPEDMPEPNTPGYTRAVVAAARPMIEAMGGRTFMLFTSYRALREAESLLEGTLDFPLLVQGRAPRDTLLREFREHGNAVLLGTGSFWEGVDVRGPALSLVVIDKLPFAPPDDPVLAARIEAIREAGGQPFMDYQLPQAVITLKQGVGRLIRDETDTGVMMICDPRLYSRSYGRIFLDALPPMRRGRTMASP